VGSATAVWFVNGDLRKRELWIRFSMRYVEPTIKLE
jgi:hypothetical protein